MTKKSNLYINYLNVSVTILSKYLKTSIQSINGTNSCIHQSYLKPNKYVKNRSLPAKIKHVNI